MFSIGAGSLFPCIAYRGYGRSSCTTVFMVMISGIFIGTFHHIDLLFFSVLTACTTFASAVSYAFQKNTYEFSSKKYDHQVWRQPFTYKGKKGDM